MAQLHSLPREILSLIIDHLDEWDRYKCVFLNKQFYNIMSSILVKLRVQIIRPRDKPAFLQRLSMLNSLTTCFIRKIIIHPFTEWSDIEFLMLVHSTTHLEELTIPFTTRIPQECVRQLPFLCPRLTSLHFRDTLASLVCTSCRGRYGSTPGGPPLYQNDEDDDDGNETALDLDCDTLLALVEHRSRLKKFSIVHPPPRMLRAMSLEPDSMAMELASFNQLTHLTLYFVPIRMFMAIFLIQWHHLLHLAIGGDIPHERLMSFLQSHSSLQSLHFTHVPFWDSSVDALANMKHPGLTEVTWFDIKSNPPISHYALKGLLESTPRLDHVIVDHRRLGWDQVANAVNIWGC